MFPIYVINLESAHERRARITGRLEGLGLPYKLIKAVSGKALSRDELAKHYDHETAIRVMGRPLTLGEIGCALSHVGIYREMVDEGVPYALILEDDVEFSAHFPLSLEALEAVLEPDQNVVYMLNHVHRYTRWQSNELKGVGELCPVVEGYCANGYVVTRASAKVLLEQLYPVHQVADNWNTWLKQGFTRIVGLVPYVVGHYREHAEKSSIEGREALIGMTGRRGIRRLAHKFGYQKFLYQLFIKPLFRISRQKEAGWERRS